MHPNMLVNWWTRDTALHSYVFCQFLIGIPFAVFNTYVIYQLQVVGYLIGTDNQGQPCTTYCIVPWGNTRLDLNSVLLYLNALAFGLGGACSLFLCAYSDYWSRKHLLVSFFIICYGAFSIPVYWLQDYNSHDFATLIAPVRALQHCHPDPDRGVEHIHPILYATELQQRCRTSRRR